MLTDSLVGHIENAVAQAGFADVYAVTRAHALGVTLGLAVHKHV